MKSKNFQVKPIFAFGLIFAMGIVAILALKTKITFVDNGTPSTAFLNQTPAPVEGQAKLDLGDVVQTSTQKSLTLTIKKMGVLLTVPQGTTFDLSYLPVFSTNKKQYLQNSLQLRKTFDDKTSIEQFGLTVSAVDAKYETYTAISKTGLVKKTFGSNSYLCQTEKTNHEGYVEAACYHQKTDGGYHVVSYYFKNQSAIRTTVNNILTSFRFND